MILADNTEPSITKIKKEYGETTSMLLLYGAVRKMLSIAGGELNDDQVNFLIEEVILAKGDLGYWAYKISDFNVITKLLASKKLYGNMKMHDVIETIEEYSNLRHLKSTTIETDSAKAKTDIPIENDKILNYYKLYKQKNKPKEKPKKSSFKESQRKAQLRYLKEKG